MLSAEGEGTIGPIVLASDGGMGDAIVASHDERFIHMDGHTTFNKAVKVLVESTQQACERAGVTLDDIDLFVYHQANGRILRSVGEKLELSEERVADYVGETGNTSAASIPLTLSLLREDGRLRPGQRLVLAAVGAGFTWGAGVVEWGLQVVPRPEGAVALVTGASKGIGSAIAKALAADGWHVAVNFRSDEAGANATVTAIEEAGGRAVALHGDIANGAVDGLFTEAEEALGGPVLALVNNAGVRADNLAIQIDDADWDTVLNTNLSAAFRLTKRSLKPMLRARYGRIVNVASVVGPRANAGQANYAAAKAGLIGLTKTVSHEVARRGITVNAVAPGFIETDMTKDMLDDVVKAIPARRAGQPEEVAAAVRFLASDDAAYVTGTTLFVDGGMSA